MAKDSYSNEKKKLRLNPNGDIITLENVSKAYASTGAPALNGVNLRIKKGEFVFIIGDSGSGKSTMIKLLLKELTATDGKIMVMGQDLNRLRHRKIPKYRRNLGIVFQDFRLLKDRNVYENVAFAQRIIQVPGKEIKRNVPSILATVGLAGKYKARPKQLSGGEQQRIAIAIALANSPKLLLADEPTGSVDTATADYIFDLFRELNNNGQTILIVTHDMALSKKVKRVVAIRDGKISSERVLKEEFADRVGESSIDWRNEETQDDYVVMDKAHRLQIPKEIVEEMGFSDNKVKLTYKDGSIIITKP